MSFELIQSDTLPEGFTELPAQVYANDPQYTPGTALAAQVFRTEFTNRQQIFLLNRAGVPAARLIARLNGDQGMIGFFEARNDPEAVQALFAAAIKWLNEQGATSIIGPIDGDTWHHYRLNVGPFDRPPFKLEPYNPAYYPDLWTGSGFTVLQEYYSQHIENFHPIVTRMAKFQARAARSGLTFRMMDLEHFEAELDILYDLSLAVFRDNFLYTDISREAFHQLYLPAKPYIVPHLVWFAFDAAQQPVGFAFALPNDPETVNLKTIGVLPTCRGNAVAGVMMGKLYEQAATLGFTAANHCLIMEGNVSGGLDCGLGVVSRNYHLYEYRPPS